MLPTPRDVNRLKLLFVQVDVSCAQIGDLAIEICAEEGKNKTCSLFFGGTIFSPSSF